MAASLSYTEIVPVLRELFPDGVNDELIYKNHPLLGMMRHDTKFGGRYRRIPIRYGKPASTSASFTKAQANAFASKYEAFNVTRVNDYGIGNITGEAVDLSKTGDKSILVEALEAEVSGLLSRLGDRAAAGAYRGTSGSRGQVGSGTSSPITLSNPEDIYFWEVGDVMSANDTDNATTLRSGVGTITAIDEDAGIITYTGTITALAVGDYLFKDGDEGACAAGLASWVPATAPTGGDSFFGVDRSASTRLSGIRFAGATYGFEEVFHKIQARIGRSSARPDYWFINPTDLSNFQVAASGQRMFVDVKEYGIGFDTISAYGVKLVSDPDCPRGITFGIPMDCFWWDTLGDAPRVVKEDGLEILRSSTSDAYEVRAVVRHNFMSDAPGLIVRATLPT